MYLTVKNHKFHYEMENLVRVFFPDKKITVCDSIPDEGEYCLTELNGHKVTVSLNLGEKEYTHSEEVSVKAKFQDESDESFLERKMAIMLFEILSNATSYTPPWGILTGVRPAKLMSNLIKKMGEDKAKRYFIQELQVSEEKTNLAFLVAKAEAPITEMTKPDSFSLYVSIPFCPTRCSYCSFISHSNESAKKLIPQYLEKLCEEIEYTGKIAKELSLRLESVYIGGGTPTVLSAEQLKKITDCIKANFDLSSIREYTIEAGRPDSLSEDKFSVMLSSDCSRISINPQTFNDDVLKEIGRNHNSEMTLNAFKSARKIGFKNINMDLIAGLPTDTLDSFEKTLDTAISLGAENITVHTLALKRSAALVTDSREVNSAEVTAEMLSLVQEKLTQKGYVPYYMYRQSKSLGNLENVGWAKPSYEGLYNVFMMEECHTILSVGAGAVTKLKAPFGTQIERIFNYKYPYEYIGNFSEILNRKQYIAQFYSEHYRK